MKGGKILLPHDELYHYGVMGMKWGVRKDRFIEKTKMTAKNAKAKIKDKDFQKKIGQVVGITVASAASAFLVTRIIANRKIKIENLKRSAEILERKRLFYTDVFDARTARIKELKAGPINKTTIQLQDRLLEEMRVAAEDRMTWDVDWLKRYGDYIDRR